MQKSAIFSIRVRKKKIQGQVTRALPRKEDRAWLAGIIEGEGSVLWASYGNDEWRAKISIIMNDLCGDCICGETNGRDALR